MSAPSISRAVLIERLCACADDPMWADHAEINKSTLRAAINELTTNWPRRQLENLIDIWDDGKLPHEYRVYVEGSFAQQIEEARAMLKASEPSAS